MARARAVTSAKSTAAPTGSAVVPHEVILGPVYQLKVSLRGVRPTVWRRLRVSGLTTLKQLHLVIQAAMGWQNYHLYMFTVDGVQYGEPDPELPCARADAATLREVMPKKSVRCVYEYDFGDGWEHVVTVEAIGEEAPVEVPICLDGLRACPPEDSGGPHGYAHLRQALRDPRHPEHEDYVTWAGSDFDPERFDLEAANRRLKNQRGLAPRRRPNKAGSGKNARSRRETADSAMGPLGGLLAPLPGMTPGEMRLLAALVAVEMGSTLDTADAAAVDRAALALFSQVFLRGLNALAAERGITVPAARDGRT